MTLITRLRELMNAPFARPPGRQGFFARFAPEVCALVVVAAWAGAALWLGLGGPGAAKPLANGGLLPPANLAHVFWHPWQPAAAAAWGIAGLLLVFAPVSFVAAALAAERERDTLESLLLTSCDHGALVRGRFWSTLAPWLRLALYLLPAYFLLSLDDRLPFLGRRFLWEQNDLFAYGAAPWSHPWLDCLQKILPRVVESAHGHPWDRVTVGAGSGEGLALAGLRWANDVTSLLLVAALAFRISSRAASVRAAVIKSYLCAPAALLVIFSPDFWWAALAAARPAYLKSYWVVAVAVMAARVLAAHLFVRGVARRFEDPPQ